MTIAIPYWFANLVTVVVCGGAVWKGGRDERLVGLALAASIFGTHLFRDFSWPRVQLAELTGDILMLVLLGVISLRTRKFWPMAAAAFQFLAVMTHIAKIVDPLINQWAYLSAIVIWTHLIYIALGVGTWNAWRARRQLAKADVVAGATRR